MQVNHAIERAIAQVNHAIERAIAYTSIMPIYGILM